MSNTVEDQNFQQKNYHSYIMETDATENKSYAHISEQLSGRDSCLKKKLPMQKPAIYKKIQRISEEIAWIYCSFI